MGLEVTRPLEHDKVLHGVPAGSRNEMAPVHVNDLHGVPAGSRNVCALEQVKPVREFDSALDHVKPSCEIDSAVEHGMPSRALVDNEDPVAHVVGLSLNLG